MSVGARRQRQRLASRPRLRLLTQQQRFTSQVDRWHCIMSTTWLTTLTLPLRNVNCFAAPLQFIVCTAWGRWGRRDNHARLLHKFILPCIARVLRCLFPPLSLPCSAGNRRSTDSSVSYHVDDAVKYRIGCHGRKKYLPITILPNTCKYRPVPNTPIPVSFEP